MKIEFRKIPLQPKEFALEVDSVRFGGTFCKISPKLVDIKSNFSGTTQVSCCKCGVDFEIPLNEEIDFLLSDGVYSSDDQRDLDKIIIEINDDFIDFEEILQGELRSLQSDYHICDSCSKDDSLIEIEY